MCFVCEWQNDSNALRFVMRRDGAAGPAGEHFAVDELTGAIR